MVALERNISGRKRIGCQSIEDASRIRTSVHVVTQRYSQAISRRAFFEVALDFRYHLVEQVRPTVDVANDVGSAIFSGVGQISSHGLANEFSVAFALPRTYQYAGSTRCSTFHRPAFVDRAGC